MLYSSIVKHDMRKLTRRRSILRILSLLVASNYLAFRVELFKDEEARYHPKLPGGVSYSAPTLNWETFDKDNAPKAFVVHARGRIELVGFFAPAPPEPLQSHPPFQLVHDKSPPAFSGTHQTQLFIFHRQGARSSS